MKAEVEKEIIESEFSKMDSEQKRLYLYMQQKKTLDSFLERGAISGQQYDKSLGDLKVKMGITE